MPQVQIVNSESYETPNRAEENLKTFFTKLGKDYKEKSDRDEIGKILGEHERNRKDADNFEKTQLALEKSTISPSRRLEAQKTLNETQKLIIDRDKALNAKVNKGILTEEEKQRQKGNLLKAGWPEHSADVYLDAPPGVKQTLEREHAALIERGLRKPLVRVPEGVDVSDANNPTGQKPVFVDDPLTPQQKNAPKESSLISEAEWPEPETPKNPTQAERIKWENNNEKENNALLKETGDKKKIYRSNDNNIKTMTQINDGGYLPSGLGKLLIVNPETGDIRPTAALAKLQNPQTELYVKNLKQWLKGAKEFFGARVTNFDVTAFMAQLPSLMNSEQGRRLILKQMQYNNDLEALHNNTLNEGLKKYGRNANYNQISKVVDGKVSEKEEDLIGKINNLVLASRDIENMSQNPEKFKGMTLMQTPTGEFRAVPQEKVSDLKKKKWRDF